MTYLLDTDTIIYLLLGSRSIADKIQEVGEDNIATTVINLAELYFGAFNSRKVEENLRTVDEFRRVTEIIGLDSSACVLFGKLKATLKRDGKLLNDSDLFIASIAVSTNSVLVTNNVRHFNRVPGLAWQNWAQG